MRTFALAVVLLLNSAIKVYAEIDERYAPFYFDPSDPSVAILVGGIDARTPLAFSRLSDELPFLENLYLSSPGGSVYSAILIAREVDRLGLTTVIPVDEECLSACSFIYFAGHERLAFGTLGVHQVSSDDPDLVAAQVALSDISELLNDFAVPNEIFLLMLRTPPESMHMLGPQELDALGLVGVRPTRDLQPESDGGGQPNTLQQEPHQSEESSIADGIYSSGELTVVVDGGLVGITYTGRGCIGSLDAELRAIGEDISFVGDGCTIAVTKLGPFDFSMVQGPGCSMYHGANCSFDGYVRRSN